MCSADDLDLKVVTEARARPRRRLNRPRGSPSASAKHVKSNTIIYAKDRATVGIGAGQMSRVDSVPASPPARRRMRRPSAGLAVPLTKGSVVASDAFFPFADGLEVVVEAGATAVVQPGGSMRDQEVIDAANKAGIAMVTTGMRHFRH